MISAPSPEAAELGGNPDSDSGFKMHWLLLAVAVFVVIAFPSVIIGKDSFFYRDMGQFGYPLAQFHREAFWRGEIPLWNPYNNCGLPFLAQWNTLVLYPGSLIYLLLPLPFGLNVFMLAHLFLAAAGMYSLAWRWTGHRFAACVAGLAFAWNGLTLHSLMWPNNIAALGWMPWVVLAMERAWGEGGRRIAIAALVGAMQMLTGAPEIILLTWLVAGIFWLRDFFGCDGRAASRTALLWRFVSAGSLVFLLSSAQLLPFIDLLRHSNRDASFGGTAWSMPLWGPANFLVPLFGCTPSMVGVYSQDAQQWTSSYYVGIGTVALALLGVWACGGRIKWLTGITLVGLVLSMGDAGYLLPALKKILPSLGFIRFPIKYVTLAIFTLPLLAAHGVTAFASVSDAQRTRARLGAVFVAVLALVVALVGVARFHPVPGTVPQMISANAVARVIFLILILGALHLSREMTSFNANFARVILLLFLGADVLWHMPAQNPVVPSTAYGPLPADMTAVPLVGLSRAMISPPMQQLLSGLANPDPFTMFTGHRRMLLSDCNLIDHVPKVNGFYSLYLREADEVTRRLYRTTNYADLPLLDFLGVSQLSSANELFVWNSRTNAMPLVTAGQRVVLASDTEAFEAIFKRDFDPQHIVYLPNGAQPDSSAGRANPTRVVSSSIEREKISIEVDGVSAGPVVIAQAFNHCWSAWIDGKAAPVWTANFAFQAVIVPAGHHRLELRYVDPLFRYGTILSVLSLLGCIGFAVVGKRAAPKSLPSET